MYDVRRTKDKTTILPIRRLGIVGLGLIGGSVGLAARRRRVAREVIGWSRSRHSVREALRRGAITRTARSPEQVARSADLVIIATPVGTIAPMAKRLLPHLKPGAVLTEVGSTKARIVNDIERLLSGHKSQVTSHSLYAGSHPLAGSEKSGVAFARAELFRGSVTVVTKTRRTPPQAVKRISAFWRRLGARVVVMSPKQHDVILARTSHLPHLVAVSLVSTLHNGDRPFTASGFKDVTRIAASSPELWRDVWLANASETLKAISAFERSLRHLKRALRSRNRAAVLQTLRRARADRETLE